MIEEIKEIKKVNKTRAKVTIPRTRYNGTLYLKDDIAKGDDATVLINAGKAKEVK